jgi:hypothetical protein
MKNQVGFIVSGDTIPHKRFFDMTSIGQWKYVCTIYALRFVSPLQSA